MRRCTINGVNKGQGIGSAAPEASHARSCGARRVCRCHPARLCVFVTSVDSSGEYVDSTWKTRRTYQCAGSPTSYPTNKRTLQINGELRAALAGAMQSDVIGGHAFMEGNRARHLRRGRLRRARPPSASPQSSRQPARSCSPAAGRLPAWTHQCTPPIPGQAPSRGCLRSD